MENFNAAMHALTEGLRDLPTGDIERVRRFLAEYLGDTHHPVPFGGRAQDFARLDNWLGERAGHSTPCWLLRRVEGNPRCSCAGASVC